MNQYGTHFAIVNFYLKSLCTCQLHLHAPCSVWIVRKNCSTHFVSYLLRLNSLCCISTHYRFWHSSMYTCDCPCHIGIQIDHSWGGKTYIYFSNCTNRHHCERSLAGHNKIKVATANILKTFWSSIYICASFAWLHRQKPSYMFVAWNVHTQFLKNTFNPRTGKNINIPSTGTGFNVTPILKHFRITVSIYVFLCLEMSTHQHQRNVMDTKCTR